MNSSRVMDSFYEYFKKEKYTDITLVCEMKKIKCHKLVLSSCPYFHKLFQLLDDTNQTVIALPNVKLDAMMSVLNYLYCKKVDQKFYQNDNFRKLAEMFQIEIERKETLDFSLPEIMSQETIAEDLYEFSMKSEDYDYEIGEQLTMTMSSINQSGLDKVNSVSLAKFKTLEPNIKKQKIEVKRFKCNYCNRHVHEKSPEHHQNHCFLNINRQPLKCPECYQDYEFPSELRDHITRKHPEKRQRLLEKLQY